jgi:hypothetical protein
LLARIRQEASDSYRYFRTPGELGRLVRDDLASLLSERFAATRPAAAAAAPPGPRGRGLRPLPVGTTSLVGREQAIEEVAGLLGRPEVRLVTLTGPGGVGKTRLALAAAEQLRDRFGGGTVFVPLAGVTRPEQVVAGIGRAVGADLAGTDSPLEVLAEQFGHDRWLLVLDNLEQVLEVAVDLEALLARCPGVALLATSRTVLGLRAEREYPVAPLLLPADPAGVAVQELASAPAVALLWTGRARCAPTSPSPGTTRGRWWSCAGGWRACRWRSSWPPPAPGCWTPTRCLAGWPGRWTCWGAARWTCPNASTPCGPRSSGAWVCWRTPSGRCWRLWPPSWTVGPSRRPPRSPGRQPLVRDIGNHQGGEQPAEHLAEELVEDAAGDPLGDRGQWEDVAHVPQVDAAGDCRPGPDRPDQLGHDVGAHRRVERVGVVDDGVAGVELVAVLAVDELLGQRREGGRVRQPEHVHQPRLDERPPDTGFHQTSASWLPTRYTTRRPGAPAKARRAANSRRYSGRAIVAATRWPSPSASSMRSRSRKSPASTSSTGPWWRPRSSSSRVSSAGDSKMSLPAAPPMWVSDRNTSRVSSGSRRRMAPSAGPSLVSDLPTRW